MTDLRINASVSVDGRSASAELRRLAGDIGLTKVAMTEAQAASRAAAAALKAHAAAADADAAEVARLRDALVAARAEEALATRQHALSGAAMNAHGRAMQGLANTAGQTRAAMTNLGQQVGDVAQGFAAGISPLTIFAQQGGQVAFALSGVGGRLGQVATFLSGPYGAAILGATIVMGSLYAASQRAAEADDAQKNAKDRLAKAIKDFREAADGATTSQDALARESIRLAEVDLRAAEAKRIRIRELIAEARAELELRRVQASAPGQRGETAALGLDVAARRAASLDALEAANEAAIRRGRTDIQTGLFALGTRDAKARDEVARATLAAERAETRLKAAVAAGTITAAAARAELDRYLAAIERAREAKSGAAAADRAAARSVNDLAAENRRLAEVFNPLLAAQQDYRKNLDDIARAEARGIASAGQAADARLAAEVKLRQARLAALGAEASAPARLAVGAGDLTAGLAARVREGDDARELDAVVAGIGRDLGLTTARDFGRAALEFSQVIGNGIAGGFGRALQRSTAVAALVDRLAPGQGRIVGAVSEQVLRDAFRPITAALEKLFGADGALAKGLGRVLGGAAAGGATADLAGRLGIGLSRAGAEIGGAIGGTKAAAKALEKVMKGLGDFAPLIGGLVGGIAGKLLGPRNPFADVALATTAAGVSGSVFNQRGEGSAARGNTLASAVQDQLARLASALGADIRPGQSLGAIGFSGDQYFFNRTGGDFKAAGNERFGSAEEAVAAAVANALATGAIATSPRVQAALSRYAGNVNTAVAEALKVRDLEALIEARGNPFVAAFRDFERQARQRLDVARQHGFELIAIERLNADQRSALIRETLERATGSARALLDDFRFGDRAGGSVRDRLGALGTERDRLAGLVRGGDTGQLDALASVIRQIDDAQREAFGSTGEAASGRASSAALLQELVDATEARVRAASDEARRAQAEQLATQRSMDATLEDIFQTGRQQLAALDAIAAGLRPAGGAYDFALASGAAR
ncbi:MAG: phage tail length tape measure family protein [Alphaproteobacteria bacterium]|nr:phage tail length tape measure family protein [Alphaproteobacteria bacterium]